MYFRASKFKYLGGKTHAIGNGLCEHALLLLLDQLVALSAIHVPNIIENNEYLIYQNFELA